MSACCADRFRRAFTLIELLVVVAIIALLVSILMPALSKARLLAKRAACATNMRSIALAAGLYRGDYEERIPVHVGTGPYYANPYNYETGDPQHYVPSWRFALARYGGVGANVFDCPASRQKTALNARNLMKIDGYAEAAGLDLSSTNRGSIGIMTTMQAHNAKAVQFGTSGKYDIFGGFDGAYMNTTGTVKDIAWRAETGWKNPQKSMYVADAYIAQAHDNPVVAYPSDEGRTAGTNAIHWPYGSGYEDKLAAGIRRFADRHAGTNVLMINGSVREYKTQDLDDRMHIKGTMTMTAGNIWYNR